ncbi:beta-1,3-galactosyltransferase 1-like [Haliotis cracherodii]|uniref:beta-1,3-galactosyltransferase 1-like n=1 Tax=Haliotis cracherodii TaxID=6455 RepID=UPI0039E833A3
MAVAFKYWKFKKRVFCLGTLILMGIYYGALEFRHLQYRTQERYLAGRLHLRPRLEKKRFVNLYFKKLLNLIMTWFIIKNDNQLDKLLNKHSFVFGLNSRQCLNVSIGVLIVVHSDPSNVEKRSVIRNTWGSVTTFRNTAVVCVFMMGERNNIQQEIVQESILFGDIVQGNFKDSYKNLTYKHVMSLHWVTTQCHDVRTIVKVDDDVFVNIFKLVNFSLTTGHLHNSLYCTVLQTGRPFRKEGKWITSREEYPFEFFPTYCEGMAYILSVDEAKRLTKASENMRFYWIDDVYVTGILAHKAGIGHTQLLETHKSAKAGLSDNDYESSVNDVLFFHDFKTSASLWEKVKFECCST